MMMRFRTTLALVAVLVAVVAPVSMSGTSDALNVEGGTVGTVATWNVIEYGRSRRVARGDPAYSERFPESHWVWDVADLSIGVGCGFASGLGAGIGTAFVAVGCAYGITK